MTKPKEKKQTVESLEAFEIVDIIEKQSITKLENLLRISRNRIYSLKKRG